MSTAKITLIGMYQWMHDNNEDLFANLSTPSGVDRQILINTILMNGAEFEVLYADSDYFKFLIGIWSDKWQRTMKKWAEVLAMEYNPIENYDRKESWVDSKIDKESTTRSESASGLDVSNSTGSGNTTNTLSAYDSSDYSPHDKADTSTEGSNASSSITDAHGNTSAENTSNGSHSGLIHGNIGVKTTQSMVMEEIDVSKFNLYDEISNLFLTEFVVYTY